MPGPAIGEQFTELYERNIYLLEDRLEPPRADAYQRHPGLSLRRIRPRQAGTIAPLVSEHG